MMMGTPRTELTPDDAEFKEAVFGDAGYHARQIVRVRVTDCHGVPYQTEALEGHWNGKTGDLILPKGRDVTYGELMAGYLALRVALREKKRYVGLDHDSVVTAWSSGKITTYLRRKKNRHARKLAREVAFLREHFEAAGGRYGVVLWVSGRHNPADLKYGDSRRLTNYGRGW